MGQKYILGMDFTFKEALRNKVLLEKMLPECKIGIISVNRDTQDNALYL